jgi:hypothetical protein
MEPSLPFLTRLWFAWVCAFRVLFDAAFAARAYAARNALPPAPAPKPIEIPKANVDSALQLLALLQRQGRLIDFLQEDITGADDRDLGAAARVVHQGCRKALADHGTFVAIATDEEGATITLADAPKGDTKLVGNVPNAPPFKGVLKHRGWRVVDFSLPVTVGDHDASVIAPCEIEIG